MFESFWIRTAVVVVVYLIGVWAGYRIGFDAASWKEIDND